MPPWGFGVVGMWRVVFGWVWRSWEELWEGNAPFFWGWGDRNVVSGFWVGLGKLEGGCGEEGVQMG